MPNIIEATQHFIEREKWKLWICSKDDRFLATALTNFQEWRKKPEDAFTHKNIDERIAILQAIIRSRQS